MERLTEKDTHRVVMGGYKIVDGNGNVIKEYKVDTIAKKECDIYNKLKELEDIEQELGVELRQLRRKSKYLIIDVENFIKNCKQFVYKTTDNELVISLNAKLRMDDKIENDLEDYLKECVVKTLLRQIENKSLTKEKLEK